MEQPDAIERFGGWLVPRWPAYLRRAGFALFALACVASNRLPIETIYVGPALMLAGAMSSLMRVSGRTANRPE